MSLPPHLPPARSGSLSDTGGSFLGGSGGGGTFHDQADYPPIESSPTGALRSLSERFGTELLLREFSRVSDLDLNDESLGIDTKPLVEDISRVYSAVFKLFVTHVLPHYTQPWLKQQQQTSISSGFCINVEKRWMLTNAHSVSDAVVIQVLKRGDTRKYFARALCVADECDLALLTVNEDSFWEGVPELKLSKTVCRLQDTVSLIGYPVGGSNIAITQGVVSRMDLTDYAQSFETTQLLTVQIDAAISAGNSGGPVLNGKLECIGVAFQGLSRSDVENCGYAIPISIVDHFLEDYVRHERFTGFCTLAVIAQAMENDAIRELHKMAPNQTGILVRDVSPETEAAQKLKVDDVILTIDGQTVSNDGTVEFMDGERIVATHLVNSKFPGDQMNLSILRDGQVISVEFKLETPHVLIPPKPKDSGMYFIVAGLVFLPLSLELLNMKYLTRKYGDYAVPPSLRVLDLYKKRSDEEVVVLNNILAHEINVGYKFNEVVRLTKFNGHEVRNLRALIAMVEGCTDEWSRFEFDGTKDIIVFKTEEMKAATTEVLAQNLIPAAKPLSLLEDGGQT